LYPNHTDRVELMWALPDGDALMRQSQPPIQTAMLKLKKDPSEGQNLFKREYIADICLTCCLREVTAGVEVAFIKGTSADMSIMAKANMQRLPVALQS